MNTKLATSQIRLKNWATIIQDRKESGLSVNDYCSQHQLSRDAYYYWLRKIKENLLVESGFVVNGKPCTCYQSCTTLAGVSPVTVIASEPCS